MNKITEFYAFVAKEEDGEGVMAFKSNVHGWMPMVGADMTRVKDLIPIADNISKVTGKPYKILKFTKRTDITKQAKK